MLSIAPRGLRRRTNVSIARVRRFFNVFITWCTVFLRNQTRKAMAYVARKKKVDPSILAEIHTVTGRYQTEIITFDDAVIKLIERAELRGLSEETVKSYQKELKALRNYFVDYAINTDDIRELTTEHFEGFIQAQMAKGYAFSTINTRIITAKLLFTFCVDKKYIAESPLATIKQLKTRHEVGATFNKEQVRRLLAMPDINKFTGLRDYAIMLTFYHTGIRLSELGAIRVQDVLLKDRSLNVQRTKNGYARRIPLTKRLQGVLVTYLKVRGVIEETDHLFLTEHNRPLSIRQIQYHLRHYGERSGVGAEVQVSPHTFRRSFAKNKVQAGVDVFRIQALMGHSDLDMLKRYVDIYSKDLDDIIERGL